MAKISAIILGAGLSRRMGKENKLFLPIDGKPMIQWVIEAVDASKVDDIILVGSELSMDQLTPFESYRIKVVDNPNFQTGMTSSIQAGVSASDAGAYMICLGDQPKIQTSTYDTLINSWKKEIDQIVLPFYQGKKGNPAVFPNAFRQPILTHSEPEGCKGIIQENVDRILKVNVQDPGILMDVDTRDEYRQLKS